MGLVRGMGRLPLNAVAPSESVTLTGGLRMVWGGEQLPVAAAERTGELRAVGLLVPSWPTWRGGADPWWR